MKYLIGIIIGILIMFPIKQAFASQSWITTDNGFYQEHVIKITDGNTNCYILQGKNSGAGWHGIGISCVK